MAVTSEQKAAALERRLCELLQMEQELRRTGAGLIAGVDEAGRGPLAGPVVAAAVVFPSDVRITGVDDSKRVLPQKREELYEMIVASALSVGVGIVDHDEIDRINILNATFQAMREALSNLTVRPDHVLVDGNRFVCDGFPFTTVVGGDARCFSIAAASIIAKVTRDRMMVAWDAEYPGYGFARHKGYATKEHCQALVRLGCCAIHRKTFLSNIVPVTDPEKTE